MEYLQVSESAKLKDSDILAGFTGRHRPNLEASVSMLGRITSGELPVVDSHLHLTTHTLSYIADIENLVKECGSALGRPEGQTQGDFSEADFKAAVAKACGVSVSRAVFVEVLPIEDFAVAEARWVLDMCADESSCVGALVANVPV